jgi:hypothetical protein
MIRDPVSRGRILIGLEVTMRQLKVERKAEKAEYGVAIAMTLFLFSVSTPASGQDLGAFHALDGVGAREELTDSQLADVQGGQVGIFAVEGQREFVLPNNGNVEINCTPTCVVSIQPGSLTVTSTSSFTSNTVTTFSSSGSSQVNISSSISISR